MNVPFVDLRAQYQSLSTEIDAAMRRVVSDSDFILGKDLAVAVRKAIDRAVAAAN